MTLYPAIETTYLVHFAGERVESFVFEGRKRTRLSCTLASVTAEKAETLRFELPPMICDFPNVFQEDLSWLPP